MSTEKRKEVILGTSMGYTFEMIKPYIVTLQKSGFKGDLCLFVSQMPKESYKILRDYGVKLIPFVDHYPYLPKSLFSDELDLKNSFNQISVKYLRYLMYYLFLLKNGGNYSKVMLSDVKDIIFQRDPFDFGLNGGLYCFLEDNQVTLKNSPFNSGRILRHFGNEVLEQIGDHYPSCAGTIFGGVPEILDYLKNMIELIKTIDPVGGGDQGLHNYLIYSGRLKNLKLVDNKKGPVFTVGSEIRHKIRFNKKGLVINDLGEVVNTVHQYDRHPDLFDGFLRKYQLKVPMEFYLKVIYFMKSIIENIVGWDFFNQAGWKLVNRLKYWKPK